MYSLKCAYPKLTAKGIKKSYSKRHVRYSAFVDALHHKQQSSTARFKTFRYINHVVTTIDIEKCVYLILTRNATFCQTTSLHWLMNIIDCVPCEEHLRSFYAIFSCLCVTVYKKEQYTHRSVQLSFRFRAKYIIPLRP